MMSICFRKVFQLHKHFHDTSDSVYSVGMLCSCWLQMIECNLAEGTTSKFTTVDSFEILILYLKRFQIPPKSHLVWLAKVNLLFSLFIQSEV